MALAYNTIRHFQQAAVRNTALLTPPTGFVAGDGWVLVVMQQVAATPALTGVPAGWVLQSSSTTTTQGGGSSGYLGVWVYTKVAASNDTSFTITGTGGGYIQAEWLSYTGEDTTNMFDSANATVYNNLSTTNITAPAVTTTRPNDIVIRVFMANGPQAAPPSTPALTMSRGNYFASEPAYNIVDESQATAGASATRSSILATNDPGIATTIAIQAPGPPAVNLAMLI